MKDILTSFERPEWSIRVKKKTEYINKLNISEWKISELPTLRDLQHGLAQDVEVFEVREAPSVLGIYGLYLLMQMW